ncbi:hypothetical protein TIFTF001_051416 [Ficus carica]|uniref:Sulfotransferase n=1 Tax=Ficus carica TaxID=3494 RepID=A0AA88D2I6_FICCA|nr:hypothetical protein TIFTF001_051415 [Ficus carica]GMN25119.1 hypothetical protein TIFTF001_051416 [Ficus carica]
MSTEKEVADEFEAIIKNLPREKNLVNDVHLYYYQGCWIPDLICSGVFSSERNFMARDDDIILSSCPKSGTTWLKALLFSIVNRTYLFALADNNPLLKANPHELVPFIYHSQSLNIETIPPPRLLATHLLYDLLPPSIKTSSCKIVYVSRNPMDQFISLWHFSCKLKGAEAEPHHLEECFDRFCRGIHAFGPFWDHVLGYWKASLERPHKILFLKYEELKKDTATNIKKLAEFLELPFSEDEEKQGVVEEILTLCSLENLKNLAANKNGTTRTGFPNSAYFRKGEVGDWKNFLTASMVERMEKIMKEKFGKYNFSFES